MGRIGLKIACRLGIPVAALLLFCLFCGGDPESPKERKVLDLSGSNLLALRPSAMGYPSIIWRTNDGTAWRDKRVISPTAFQGAYFRTRCVCDIYSFDGAKGTAIIKVAEELPDAESTNGALPMVYSWREWNLVYNGEVKVLRICKDPYEPY
jgi:hypothetical protein